MDIEQTSIVFTQVRDWAELLYFISGVILVFIAGFGLRQLKLTKDQLELAKKDIHSNVKIFKTQSHRAAVESAVVECRRYSDEIVQVSLELDSFCKAHELTYFKDVIFERTNEGFKLHTKDIKSSDVKKLAEAEPLINRYVNGMEAFALFFLSGVADEKIAFHTNGKTFVNMSEEMFKLFPICNASDEDAKPIKALYFMWRKKLDNQKMLKEKEEIEQKLKEYDQKEIKPIGT
ncbi:hypothetical protein C0J08_05880 [Marinomonas sp. CT5]|uniref:hypothetical protein n=1 Tax=Marinomonas sp. CT5 TaxID=2066133 RepID=UPI001BAF3E7D|nr:hypothetical protein [Marinomonas sp. CT5]QUX94970.1 hypothetical protein C0J08_05880 [Marinomonas sp. CT5]